MRQTCHHEVLRAIHGWTYTKLHCYDMACASARQVHNLTCVHILRSTCLMRKSARVLQHKCCAQYPARRATVLLTLSCAARVCFPHCSCIVTPCASECAALRCVQSCYFRSIASCHTTHGGRVRQLQLLRPWAALGGPVSCAVGNPVTQCLRTGSARDVDSSSETSPAAASSLLMIEFKCVCASAGAGAYFPGALLVQLLNGRARSNQLKRRCLAPH